MTRHQLNLLLVPERMEDPEEIAIDRIERKELRREVLSAIKEIRMKPRDKEIAITYLLNQEGRDRATYKNLASKHGIGSERVRQIVGKFRIKMLHRMQLLQRLREYRERT